MAWARAAAGLYLAAFLVLHVGAVLFGRVRLHLDTNFYFAAAGFHVPPFQFFFAPYYFLGVLALFVELGARAHARKAGRAGAAPAWAFAIPVLLGLVVAALIVAALAGCFFPVDVPALYKATYAAAPS